ncbi:protein EMBRYO SAC DEVELOPMENT ARREST 30-like [Phragmites australis]|uniref:protein EMBRYO SAC DEVELOPMENT ARREST 30-like n=1 Tax=Phragmites australis TaxID=29695 RepID=UPI002D77F2C1|nr:protein EMBRYO SAC DEVELOPMENT ARREST 30-like [Phragmites australis]
MLLKSKFKLATAIGIMLSMLSLLVHLFLANYSAGGITKYSMHMDDALPFGSRPWPRRLWGPLSTLDHLHPFSKSREPYAAPTKNNGFIYAKIYGGFEKIQSSICDLVAVARLLNATLVIPEIQATTRAKGISPKFKSFSYLYDEEHFITALSNDVAIVHGLPKDLKEARKKFKFSTVSPRNSATPEYYITEVLPRLVKSKVIGIIVNGGKCLQSVLPASLEEFQRLRCRVAFHALKFRPQIRALGSQITGRLRASGRPYLAYHPGLLRDTLAFHGCAELFQDIHTELIQYRRNQMIKRGTVKEQLAVDSVSRKVGGSCPLMPEEVGLLLQALGYPPTTTIFLAGSETFGGQRMLIPLRAMYANLVDRTSLCSQRELSDLVGPEGLLASDMSHPPPPKSEKKLIEEWKRVGPRPRPLPPPPARPFYAHEKEGWYGWIGENDTEPDPSPIEFRRQAHRLLWDALDYLVSVEADAFFPGFHNDGSGWPDYSSLIMGHRLYQTPSGITYRPDRKVVAALFENVSDHRYHPPRNWTIAAREHLNKSANVEGFISSAMLSKPVSFLSHPLSECSCRTTKSAAVQPVKDSHGRLLFGGEEECPDWMARSLATVSTKNNEPQNEDYEGELPEDDSSPDKQQESDRSDTNKSSEQDEEMDPDD